MKKYKFDFIVIIAFILVAVISWIAISFIYEADGAFVEVTVDGKIQNVYPLDEDGEYRIETDAFINTIQIKDGMVFMKEANCPDKLCVKQGKITKDGQSIICLPHRMVVRVVSEQEDIVDAYTK